MLAEFKAFLMRGNVVDLAVAVVIGAAFGLVVQAFVADIITPIIAAIFGKPDFSSLTFTINGSVFRYGDFLNALIAFVTVAAAIFFFVVKPMNVLAARRAAGQEPEAEPAPTVDQQLLMEIRDLLKRAVGALASAPAISRTNSSSAGAPPASDTSRAREPMITPSAPAAIAAWAEAGEEMPNPISSGRSVWGRTRSISPATRPDSASRAPVTPATETR